MSDDQIYEIEVKIRSRDQESVRHMEGPLSHATTEDVAADIVGHMDTASNRRLKTVPHTDR